MKVIVDVHPQGGVALRNLQVLCYGYIKVNDFKDAFELQTGLERKYIERMIYNGKPISDSNTLASYGIHDQARLFCPMRNPGGHTRQELISANS